MGRWPWASTGCQYGGWHPIGIWGVNLKCEQNFVSTEMLEGRDAWEDQERCRLILWHVEISVSQMIASIRDRWLWTSMITTALWHIRSKRRNKLGIHLHMLRITGFMFPIFILVNRRANQKPSCTCGHKPRLILQYPVSTVRLMFQDVS